MDKETNGTIIEFLLGEKSFNNAWYCDLLGGVKFWWRKELREYINQKDQQIKHLTEQLYNLKIESSHEIADLTKQVDEYCHVNEGLEIHVNQLKEQLVEVKSKADYLASDVTTSISIHHNPKDIKQSVMDALSKYRSK